MNQGVYDDAEEEIPGVLKIQDSEGTVVGEKEVHDEEIGGEERDGGDGVGDKDGDEEGADADESVHGGGGEVETEMAAEDEEVGDGDKDSPEVPMGAENRRPEEETVRTI
ncbi:hypothetical protein ACET3Z_018171 [Daucus carota]